MKNDLMPPQHWLLQGKTAIVTGASKGIGLAIATELLGLGAQVLLIARKQQDIDREVSELQELGYSACGLSADVSIKEDQLRIAEKSGQLWNKLDILINNVGTNIRKRALDYQAEDIEKIFRTNLFPAFDLSRLLYPQLLESGNEKGAGKRNCSIVNISSVAGLQHIRSGAPYGMTKAALNQMTRNLAVEWAGDGIRVNAIAPWYIRTPLAEQVLKDAAYLQEVLERTPVKRIGEPHEVAGLAAFLCTDSAAFITGQCISVDGGFTINGF